MKKSYETPSIEVVKFQYRDQVVVASGNLSGACTEHYVGAEDRTCTATHSPGDNTGLK